MAQANHIALAPTLPCARKRNSPKKSDNRFEPLINFLKATNQAEKIALQENPERIRDFLKKIGSNHLVRDRALSLALKKTLARSAKMAFRVASRHARSCRFGQK